MTAAEFSWKQCIVPVSMTGLEELQNSGEDRSLPLLASRIKNAEHTMMNQISSSIYSDGTGSGGKEIGGLQLLVADTGLSTAGGISSTTYSWWRNQVYDFSTAGVSAGPITITQAMNTLWLATKRGMDEVDLIIADSIYYNYYWQSLQAIQRITSSSSAAAGYDALRFMNADVIADGAQGGYAPSTHMYFLNTKYLQWSPHTDRNMVPLDPKRFSLNQDVMTQFSAFAGNLTVSNRALQGAMVA